MKFNDGYWLLRDGVTARYATEALDVRAEAGRGSIAVLTRPVEHRGSHLNTPTITVELSAPRPTSSPSARATSSAHGGPRPGIRPDAGARSMPASSAATARCGSHPAAWSPRPRWRASGGCASPATACR